MGYQFSKDFEIRYYETDLNQRLQLPRLLNYFDDIAVTQTEKLGVGIDYLKSINAGWFLGQWKLKISRLPVFGETVRIHTDPSGFYKYYARRDFEVKDAEGNSLIEAESIWFYIDTIKLRPLRIPPKMFESYGTSQEDADPIAMDVIPEPSLSGPPFEVIVNHSDIDTNGHANNSKYAEWAIDSLPFDIPDKHFVSGLKCSYKKQAKPGDRLLMESELINEKNLLLSRHKLKDSADNVLCILEFSWDKEEHGIRI